MTQALQEFENPANRPPGMNARAADKFRTNAS
jgi:hypothetical protein